VTVRPLYEVEKNARAALLLGGSGSNQAYLALASIYAERGDYRGGKLRICKPTSTRTVRSRQTKAARYSGSGTQIGKQHGKTEVSPNSLGSRVARSLHTYLDPGSQSQRGALVIYGSAGHVRGAVGNQGVLVASIPDFIMGALPFIVSAILEEFVFLPCYG
jgi:hypothetical protein